VGISKKRLERKNNVRATRGAEPYSPAGSSDENRLNRGAAGLRAGETETSRSKNVFARTR